MNGSIPGKGDGMVILPEESSGFCSANYSIQSLRAKAVVGLMPRDHEIN
jgi:hypothetical protein